MFTQSLRRTGAAIAVCLLSTAPAYALSDVCRWLGQGKNAAAQAAGAEIAEVRQTYSNGVYIGQKYDGNRCGRGAYYFDSGTILVGVWDVGKMRQGMKIFPSGAVTVAEFDENGEVVDNADKTFLIYSSGAYYKGGYRDGKRNGDGTFVGSKGQVYSGPFRDGKYNGEGKYCSFEREYYFKGRYVDGKRDGEGIIRYLDGTLIEGVWRSGKLFFGVGEYKGKQSIFYAGDGVTEVRSIQKWCEARDMYGDRCAAEYSRRASLETVGTYTFPKSFQPCYDRRDAIAKEHDDLMFAVRQIKENRP
ncbi:hypothetical protein [Aestuariivita boseongensis]|uniref:hypothetical protein n=1 Tax=Aestuariivita boseongensis TaxID=1470562 RepID=UPI00068321B1|nr:hypothetical protein [Aestuariivita boseongensis]